MRLGDVKPKQDNVLLELPVEIGRSFRYKGATALMLVTSGRSIGAGGPMWSFFVRSLPVETTRHGEV